MNTKMTREEARILESIAAKLLVAADERDYSVLKNIEKSLTATQAAVITKLVGISQYEEYKVLKEEMQDGRSVIYAKNDHGYLYTDHTVEEKDNAIYTETKMIFSEESLDKKIVW